MSCRGIVWVIAGLMDSKTDVNPSGQDRLEILFRVGGFSGGGGGVLKVVVEKNSRISLQRCRVG